MDRNQRHLQSSQTSSVTGLSEASDQINCKPSPAPRHLMLMSGNMRLFSTGTLSLSLSFSLSLSLSLFLSPFFQVSVTLPLSSKVKGRRGSVSDLAPRLEESRCSSCAQAGACPWGWWSLGEAAESHSSRGSPEQCALSDLLKLLVPSCSASFVRRPNLHWPLRLIANLLENADVVGKRSAFFSVPRHASANVIHL